MTYGMRAICDCLEMPLVNAKMSRICITTVYGDDIIDTYNRGRFWCVSLRCSTYNKVSTVKNSAAHFCKMNLSALKNGLR